MSFQLQCPNCGKRNVSEFKCKGEYRPRPSVGAPFESWVDYVYFKDNKMGSAVEWWQHKLGCQRWFIVIRDTKCNTDHRSFWYEDRAWWFEQSGINLQ